MLAVITKPKTTLLYDAIVIRTCRSKRTVKTAVDIFSFSNEHKLSQPEMDALLSSGSLNTNTKNYWSQKKLKNLLKRFASTG